MSKDDHTKVNIEQRTDAWYSFRSKHIGASDACIIAGHSPWCSAHELWMRKTGAAPQQDSSNNFAIQRGIRLEPIVSAMASIMLDRDFEPATFVSKKKPYLMCSLDCLDVEYLDIGEIKVGGIADHKKLYTAEESTPDNIIVPKKYLAQLQQQMYVMERDCMWFISYHLPKGAEDMRGDLRIVKVWRDEPFLQRYLPIAEEFYYCLIENKPPRAVKIEI